MPFTFQQPGSALLLQALGTAAASADSGIAMFAFASAGGVKAFFQVPQLITLLAAKKPFHLIVGLDAITNAEALLSIIDVMKKYGEQVTAEAFFHEHSASTFHPKFMQFKVGANLRLITGSGNLTVRGLGLVSASSNPPGNWEAFSNQTIAGADAQAVAENIRAWLTAQRLVKMLRPLTDERVKARAMMNGMIRYTTRPKAVLPITLPRIDPISTPTVDIDDFSYEEESILIRELPKNRPGQADIGKAALSEFFGYSGKAIDILLQHVTLDNVLGNTESIRLFVNDSKNYRLELHAMSDFKYEVAPDDSRIILVATKLDRRSFRYTLVPVDSADHGRLVSLLGAVSEGRRFMREKRVTPVEFLSYWKKAPSNLIPTTSESPLA